MSNDQLTNDDIEQHAFDFLHNQLDFNVANGPFWHDDYQHNARDNFSPVGPPPADAPNLIRFGCNLWATINLDEGKIFPQVEDGLRRMSRRLADKADEVRDKGARQAAWNAECDRRRSKNGAAGQPATE